MAEQPVGFIPDAPAPIVPAGFIPDGPTFRGSNEMNAAGHSVVRQSGGFLAQASGVPAMAEGAAHVWQQINPIAAAHTIFSALSELRPEVIGGPKGFPMIKAIGAAQGAQYDKAAAAYKRGDIASAAIHFVNYLTPIIGPALDKSADELQAGNWAAGTGDAIGIGLAMFGPQKLGEAAAALKARAPVAPRGGPGGGLNAAEQASNAFAEARGVPLDAATATGSRTLRAAQKRVANSMGGEGTATDLILGQQEALGRVGGELAAEAGGPRSLPATAETAGQGVRDSITRTMRELHDAANQAYGKVREAEAQTVGQVPKTEAPAVKAAREGRQKASLGGATLTDAEINELRNMRDELEAQPYQASKLVDDEPGVSSGTHYTRRTGNADVYKDIGQASGSNETGARMIQSIDAALESGQFTSLSRGALDVARKRLAGDLRVSKGWVKPGTRAAGSAEETMAMNMPIDLRLAKETLGPVFERLKREGELAPLMGGKADALRALDRIVNGPDYAPMSIADGALSDLKSMARSDVPELRGAGKGTAAYAAKQLSGAIDMALEATSPATKAALERGRAATATKYQAGDLLGMLRDEPVRAFAQLTAPRDTGIKLLRQVKDFAPAKLADVARAWLEDRIDFAQQEGGFGHSARLWSDWNKLGRETKRILFPKAGQIEALDQFFLLAKRVAENPNPSGTAHNLTVLNFSSQPAMYGLAKLLYTPRGVSALNRVLRMSPTLPTRGAMAVAASQTAQAAAWADLVSAAKAAGVSLPLAADSGSREAKR